MQIDKTKYHHFNTVTEAESWGEQHYGQWAEEYKSNMFQLQQIIPMTACSVIERYCGYDYQHINYILRYPETEYSCKNTYIKMSETLAVIIMCAPKIPKDIIIYRGVTHQFVEQLFHSKYEWVQEKGFLSTSLCHTIDLDHGYDSLLRIYLPKGTPAAYVSCVAGRSEQELLLLPNSFIRLIDKSLFSSLKKSKEHLNGHPVFNCELSYMI